MLESISEAGWQLRRRYEEVIVGFDQLSQAAQFEVEYLYPLVGRLYDLRGALRSLERDQPGRIPPDILREVAAMYDLGNERVDGQRERAKAASNRSTEGFTVDHALSLMLELRDARMERHEFEGTFGEAKKRFAERVRYARVKVEASAAGYAIAKGGKKKWSAWKPQDSQPPDAAEGSEAAAGGGKGGGGRQPPSSGKGKPGGGGRRR